MSSDKHCCVPGCKESRGMSDLIFVILLVERKNCIIFTNIKAVHEFDIIGIFAVSQYILLYTTLVSVMQTLQLQSM